MVEAEQSPIEFRVLGAVAALRDGKPLPLGGPRQRALLSLLLLEPGRPLTADRLVDELWAGEPPNGAETTLRSYVSRLRATLGDGVPISGTAGGYALSANPEQVDARRFERLVRDAEAALGQRKARRARELLAEGLGLWRGTAFGELAADGTLRVEAERLAELRTRAIELRIEAMLALGGGASLVDELEALVREHPFRERLWRQLMLALYRADRQADALGAYRRAREQLAEQLGLEPGEELERLQLAILRHEVPPAIPPEARHNLPAPLTSFIGRDAELAEVGALLAANRLVTLTGVGGVGKTRLALEAARRRLDDHADGVWFVDLGPLAEPAHVAGQLGTIFDIREQSGASTADRLVNELRERDLLLVLDNCEHLREACASLASRLLQACPDLRILATSRELLGVPGEVDDAVPTLRVPATDAAPETVRTSEAVQLFLARARAARPSLPDDDSSLATIARICLDLEGLPLGIELAAARAKAFSISEIATRLADRFRFLVSWRRLTAARHRTLREAMDWSYELLPEEEQVLLRRLSVFAGGSTLEAVAAVCTDSDEPRAAELIGRLAEASLLIVDATAPVTRYRLLETVRQYGAEQLRATAELPELERRHAAYYAALVETAWAPVRSTAELGSRYMATIGPDVENVRAALAWSRDAPDPDRLLRLAEGMWWYWWIRGQATEGRTWLELAIGRATDSDSTTFALALQGAAGLAWAQGDWDRASTAAELGRASFARLGYPLGEGGCLNILGLAALGRGENATAEASLHAARRAFLRVEEPGLAQRLAAVAIDNLGSAALDRGDFEIARRRYGEAGDIYRASREHDPEITELHLGFVAVAEGDITAAGPLLAKSLAYYRALGFMQYVAEGLEGVAAVANARDAPGDAAFLLAAATRLRERLAHPPSGFLDRLRQRELAAAREALGEVAAYAAIEAGRVADPDAANERALAILAG